MRQDREEALRWYRLAMDQDSIPSVLAVADFYRTKMTVTRDLEEARRLILLAAELTMEQDNPGGLSSAASSAIRIDINLSNSLLEQLAEAGCWRGANGLANRYQYGDGLPRDYIKAYMWFNVAVALGHRDALNGMDQIDLTRTQEVEAQRLAGEWLEAHPPLYYDRC